MNLYKKNRNLNTYFFLCIFSFILIISSNFGLFRIIPVKDIFLSTVSQNATNLKNSLNFLFSRFEDNANLVSENLKLRKQLISSEADIQKNHELESTIESLNKYNLIKTYKKASNSSKSISTVFSGNVPVRILIDEGSKNGIKQNQIVINDTGTLIGIIDNVDLYTSSIKPYYVYDDIKFPIKSNTVQTALIQGSIDGKVIGINLNPDINIKIGEDFFTSSLGDKMPDGIYIGKVNKIDQNDKKIFYLDTDILNIDHLYVLQ